MRGSILAIGIVLMPCSADAATSAAPICADRPSKSTGPCTVPQGKWQIEAGLVDWSRDHSDGATTTDVAWGNTGIKYGISGRADLELWVTPLVTEHVRSPQSRANASSVGDTLIRVKYALTPDDSPVQVALDPFVKIPTANHRLGNGKVEAGLLAPVQIGGGNAPLTLSFDPELDVLADSGGHGWHGATQQVVNVGIAATDKLNLSTEIWAMWDWDPVGTGKMVSWDGAVAYLVTNDLQVDAGTNFGLNSRTPDVEIYTGISIRF